MANQYFTCTLGIWVDGATIHAQMHYERSSSYFYRDTSFPTPTMTIADQTFWDEGFANTVRDGVYVGSVYTTEFTKTMSANGTYNVTFSAGAGLRNDFEGTWSGTATITSIVVAPNTPTISVTNIDSFTNEITWGTSSFGNPSTGTVYLYGGTAAKYPNVLLATKTTTGNTTFTDAGRKPNTTYYYRARAFNGSAWSSYSGVVSAKTKIAALVPYPNDPNSANEGVYVQKLEASNQGLARTVLKLYDSSDGKARRIY